MNKVTLKRMNENPDEELPLAKRKKGGLVDEARTEAELRITERKTKSSKRKVIRVKTIRKEKEDKRSTNTFTWVETCTKEMGYGGCVETTTQPQ